ncbi:MAG: Gldg family protein, partial [Vicinamibacterales bacterium]
MANKIFGIIGWIGTVLVFGAVALRMFRPEWNQYATYLAWAGLASVLLYMAGQWRDVANFYKGRGARYGTMSLVSIVVFLGILIAVNYLATRQSKRWDFTANQVYSLSDQTIKILSELKQPVKFVVFERADRVAMHRSRLDNFAYHSSQVSTEYVDADRDPLRADAAKIDQLPTILIEYQGRTEKVTSSEELALVNGLIKATTGQVRKVYFTQGHGEKDTAVTDRTGYSTVSAALTRDNFTGESLGLLTQKSVPDDAAVVVSAGPSTDFFQPEM